MAFDIKTSIPFGGIGIELSANTVVFFKYLFMDRCLRLETTCVLKNRMRAIHWFQRRSRRRKTNEWNTEEVYEELFDERNKNHWDISRIEWRGFQFILAREYKTVYSENEKQTTRENPVEFSFLKVDAWHRIQWYFGSGSSAYFGNARVCTELQVGVFVDLGNSAIMFTGFQ